MDRDLQMKRKADTLNEEPRVLRRKRNQGKEALQISPEFTTQSKKKVRTPSGTVFNAKVGDIRGFFQRKNYSCYQRSKKSSIKHRHVNFTTLHAALKCKKNTSYPGDHEEGESSDTSQSSVASSLYSAESSSDQFLTPIASRSFELEEPSRELLNLIAINMSSKETTNASTEPSKRTPQKSESVKCKNINAQGIKSPNDPVRRVTQGDSRMEKSDENPQVMDIASVKLTLLKMKEEFTDSLKTQLDSFKHDCITQAEEAAKKICQQKCESTDLWKKKSEILTQVCSRMQVEIDDLTTRVENLELNNSKKMVIVTGLQLQGKYKSDKRNHMQSFIDTELMVKAQVDDLFELASGNPKPVVVIFQTIQEKLEVMAAKSSLQGVDYDGRAVYTNDYLPPHTQERRRRERDVIKEMTPEDPQIPFEYSYTREGLQIQGHTYEKAVKPPTPLQLVDLDVNELNKTLKLPVTRGREIQKDNSVFLAYAVNVKSHEDVQKYYTKIKLIQPGARHVVCAYWVNSDFKCQAQDYQDDGEPAAGRVLLKILRQNELRGKAVFVARKYGGKKMGADRFTCYAEAAQDALSNHMGTPVEIEKKDEQGDRGIRGKQQLRARYSSTQQRKWGSNKSNRRGEYRSTGRRRAPWRGTRGGRNQERQNQWSQSSMEYEFSDPKYTTNQWSAGEGGN